METLHLDSAADGGAKNFQGSSASNKRGDQPLPVYNSNMLELNMMTKLAYKENNGVAQKKKGVKTATSMPPPKPRSTKDKILAQRAKEKELNKYQTLYDAKIAECQHSQPQIEPILIKLWDLGGQPDLHTTLDSN